MAASIKKYIIAAGLLCGVTPVFAFESLPDPTKPAVDIPYESETGKAGVGDEIPIAKKEGLQSIIISSRRRAAVINGVTVALGEKIGDATLVEVRENSVVLQESQGKRVMELYPGVHMSNSGAAKQEKVNSRLKVNKIEIKQEADSKDQESSAPVNPERN